MAGAQSVTNGGFENWAGTPTHPVGWTHTGVLINVAGDNVTKDSTAGNYVEGAASVKLMTDSLHAFGQAFLAEGGLYYGGGAFISTPQPHTEFYGIAFTGRPDSVKFAYKFSPVSGDSAEYNFVLSQWVGNSKQTLGTNSLMVIAATSGWVNYTGGVQYSSASIPDTLNLNFHTSVYNQHVGTTLWVDDLSLIYNGVSGVDGIKLYTEVSLSPNPAAAVLHVTGSGLTDEVATQIYDLTGRLVATPVLKNNAIDVSALPNGNYIITLSNKLAQQFKGRFVVMK